MGKTTILICDGCKHEHVDIFDEPCRSCFDHCNFEAKEEK